MLSVAPFETAQVQVYGTASIIREWGSTFARGGLCIAQVSASLPLRGWGCSFAGLTGEA